MMTRLSALSWMMGMLLAPHALALVGNLTGTHQRMFFIWLVISAGAHWINARSINQIPLAKPTSVGAQGAIFELLFLSSRWVTTVALSTVLLVTAGFSFNETFMHWFPNFAFASILLGTVVIVQCWGPLAARRFQLALLAVVVGGLALLVIMGLWGGSAPVVGLAPRKTGLQVHGLFDILLLFVGFDLVSNQRSHPSAIPLRTTVIGLSLMVLFAALWGWVSLRYVPVAKLSDSFIPHILAARSVGANTGRMIMGAVIIAGSGAAVNALITALSQTMPAYASRWLTGRLKTFNWLRRPVVWSVIIVSIIASMMAGGMAGSDEIDLYVRAGLILWLLYYGAIHLAVLAHHRRKFQSLTWSQWMLPALGAMTMGIGTGALVLFDNNRLFLMTISASVAILGLFLTPFFKRERFAVAKRPLR